MNYFLSGRVLSSVAGYLQAIINSNLEATNNISITKDTFSLYHFIQSLSSSKLY